MLLNTDALSSRPTTSSYERSLNAARMHELTSAVRRQRQDRRDQRRTEQRRWFAARPTA